MFLHRLYLRLSTFRVPSAHRHPLRLHAEEAEKKADLRAGFFADTARSVVGEHIFAPPFVKILYRMKKAHGYPRGFSTSLTPCAEMNCCRPFVCSVQRSWCNSVACGALRSYILSVCFFLSILYHRHFKIATPFVQFFQIFSKKQKKNAKNAAFSSY